VLLCVIQTYDIFFGGETLNKTALISIRVTPEEKRALELAAEQANVKPSKFARQKLQTTLKRMKLLPAQPTK